MKQKELEQFIEDCKDLIAERSDLALKKVAQSKKYKEKYEEYIEIYELLSNKVASKEVEQLTNSIQLLNDVESNYIYMQGFADGMLLRENLG